MEELEVFVTSLKQDITGLKVTFEFSSFYRSSWATNHDRAPKSTVPTTNSRPRASLLPLKTAAGRNQLPRRPLLIYSEQGRSLHHQEVGVETTI